MEDLQWNDQRDVLQDIMIGPATTQDLTDFRAALPIGDSASNSLLDLHLSPNLTPLDAQGHPAFMGQWSGAAAQDVYYPTYPASRFTAHQDAWNPLFAAGLPQSSPVSHMHMPAVGDPDGAFQKPHYRTPSEAGSQHLGSLYSGDSGYGSQNGGAHSVVPSSFAVDSSSPQLGHNEHAFVDSMSLFDQSRIGTGSVFTQDFGEGPFEASVKCDHPACPWVGKCPSDKRKHEARHRKLFKCDEPNCPRKEGFGTINDLARHKKCVHNKEPERGPKMMYLCFGKNCPRPSKRWPRLDNFKQHLSRMHIGEDPELLLKKSMDWYESVTGRRPDHKIEDSSSSEESLMDIQDHMSIHSGDMDADTSDPMSMVPDNVDFSSRAATPRPISSNAPSEPASSESQSEFSLGCIGLPPSSTQNTRDTAIERANPKSETFVTDAADSLINSLTKMVNNRNRRSSQNSDEGIEIDPENSQLSQPQRQMLQKVLSVALERLSDETSSAAEPADEKQDWFQCGICTKRTRLRCEMKKHQKRHERPYGCTFPHCAKSFGSKADWKRHETSQHLHLQSWLCGFHDPSKDASCGRIFYREETYTQHLTQQHRIPKTRLPSALASTRLDLGDQGQFWCGLCSRWVTLQSHGPPALDERFNHIDTEHFKKGERGCDWVFPEIQEGSSLSGVKVDPASTNVGGLPSEMEVNHRKRKYTGAHSLSDRQ